MAKKKIVNKIGFVLPYSIWDGLKQQSPEIIRDAIDICVEYDRHWLDTIKKNTDTTAISSMKKNSAAAVVFSFAKPLIDANNRRYYERLFRKKTTTEDSSKSMEEILDDSLPE